MSRTAVTNRFKVRDFGSCLNTKGSVWASITDASFNITGATASFTLSVWVLPFAPSVDEGILSAWTVSKGYLLRMDINNIVFGTDALTDQITSSISSSTLIGKWHHIVISVNAGAMTMYIDGVSVATGAIDALTSNGIAFQVGAYNNAAQFNGLIDEVAVWNRGLSAAEVTALYYQGTTPTNGLLGYWKFDENTGTSALDSSGNGKTLTLSGASWSTNVFAVPRSAVTNRLAVRDFGSCFKPNGSFVASITDASFNIVGASPTFSLSCWVYGDRKIIQGSVNQGIMSSWAANNGYLLYIASNGAIVFSTAAGGDIVYTNGALTIADGRWHHICAVSNAGAGTIYIDGVSKATGTISAITANANAFDIAGYNGVANPLYVSIDEAAIWNRGLTSAEVTALYYQGTTPTNGLLGYWKFDEGSGTTAADSSGNNKSLTLSSASWSSNVAMRPRWTVDANQNLLFARSLKTDLTTSPNSGLIGTGSPTFTRASTATYIDQNGIMQTAASGAKRFQKDPTNKYGTALLIEPAATNIILRSEDLTNAVWVLNEGTISANNVVAPDGNLTADTLVESATVNAEHYVDNAVVVLNATTYTFSIYAKAAGRNFIKLFETATTNAAAFYTLTGSGAVTTPTGSGSPTATITAVGNGWYRCALTLTTLGTGLGVRCEPATGTSTAVYTGDGVSGVTFWGAQLETGTVATSYIPTTTVAVTRNADALSYPTAGNVTSAAGTAMGWVYPNYTVASDTSLYTLLDLGGTGVNGLVLFQNGSSKAQLSGFATLNATTALTQNAWNHIALSYTSSLATIYINGVSNGGVTPTAAFTPLTTMYFGSNQGNQRFANSQILDPRIYGEALPASTITSIFNAGPQ